MVFPITVVLPHILLLLPRISRSYRGITVVSVTEQVFTGEITTESWKSLFLSTDNFMC